MSDNRPVGVFDSGLGGLTVLSEIRKLLPAEDLVYFGDSGRTPYGTKSPETIARYTLQDVNFLLLKDVKAVVIACNTATACGLSGVREKYPELPVIGVIGPGARAAVKATRSGRIGVIGTPATISSMVYHRAIHEAADAAGRTVSCYGKSCPLFVPLAEEGWWDRDVTRLTAREYLTELRDKDIDTLVLGCTHYPLLAGVIGNVMGPGVYLVNSASVVALELEKVLYSAGLANSASSAASGSVSFYCSDSAEKFGQLGSLFLGTAISGVEKINIEAY